MDPAKLKTWSLPKSVTSRFVDTAPAGLKFHILESVPQDLPTGSQPPLILLLHGFPNLSYDWRYIMPLLSKAGYHAVAPDMRGFGRTHNSDLSPVARENIRPIVAVHDVTALLIGLGYKFIHTLVGHDLGAFAASLIALARTDLVKSLVLMSHPFKGIQAPATKEEKQAEASRQDSDIQASLAKLDPPRKHYKYYNAADAAADEWTNPKGQPLHEFLRGYFHLKSADYVLNKPHPLKSWTAKELALMPHYYVMRADLSMRGNVELDMSKEPASIREKLSQTPWLPDSDLSVYTEEFGRTTFSHSLLWYKAFVEPKLAADLLPFAGHKISVPTKYVSGDRDWGTYQVPGSLEAMENGDSVEPECWRGAVHVPGAGHWVNMEKPNECAAEILKIAASVYDDSKWI
ncbi:putative epoxide hydrolase [Colletotrichum truncatum]|uniref:Epoxide hydrolase n=1 Tax=Colletotrichum truncatum TaxID=5467 RepID=A0ACC3YK55_COLTU|nr:putative epoxide hydrolase [Colletotrichum truncatum]KAF6784360.1 putative epoxide hydrolase [Colletotrichum truncatum]